MDQNVIHRYRLLRLTYTRVLFPCSVKDDTLFDCVNGTLLNQGREPDVR